MLLLHVVDGLLLQRFHILFRDQSVERLGLSLFEFPGFLGVSDGLGHVLVPHGDLLVVDLDRLFERRLCPPHGKQHLLRVHVKDVTRLQRERRVLDGDTVNLDVTTKNELPRLSDRQGKHRPEQGEL